MPKVYIVQRLYWEYNDNWFERKDDTPVRAYRTRERAREELDRDFRGNVVGPFWRACRLEDVTSLDEELLLIGLEELGAPAPPENANAGPGDTRLDWWHDGWWETAQRTVVRAWGDDARLWALFDRAGDYEVIETDLAE